MTNVIYIHLALETSEVKERKASIETQGTSDYEGF